MPYVVGATPPFALEAGAMAVLEVRCDPPRNDLALRALEALPRDVGVIGMINHVREVQAALRMHDGRPEPVKAVVDSSNMGEATARLWRASGLSPVLIEVVARRADDGAGISRIDLAALLQTVLEQRRLRWSKQLPEAAEFQRQLDGFRLRLVHRNGTDLEAAREEAGEHLVLAAALAAWWGERMRPEESRVYVAETSWSVLAC